LGGEFEHGIFVSGNVDAGHFGHLSLLGLSNGIYIDNSGEASHMKLFSSEISDNDGYGIFIDSASSTYDFRLSNSTFMRNAQDATAKSNLYLGGDYGLYWGNYIGSTGLISNNYADGVYLPGTYNLFYGNTINTAPHNGITVTGSLNYISNNILRNIAGGGTGGKWIKVSGDNNIIFQPNILASNCNIGGTGNKYFLGTANGFITNVPLTVSDSLMIGSNKISAVSSKFGFGVNIPRTTIEMPNNAFLSATTTDISLSSNVYYSSGFVSTDTTKYGSYFSLYKPSALTDVLFAINRSSLSSVPTLSRLFTMLANGNIGILTSTPKTHLTILNGTYLHSSTTDSYFSRNWYYDGAHVNSNPSYYGVFVKLNNTSSETGDLFSIIQASKSATPSLTTLFNMKANGDLDIRGNILPAVDDTYYIGKNDDDSPFAYKGIILKDTTNGKYYRIEIINGTITATDLTD
jgi:hypothetical protein